VLNDPARIARLSRDSLSALLASVPGIDVPSSVRVTRQRLSEIAGGTLPLSTVLHDGGYPVIVRPRNSHAGKGLARADGPLELDAYLDTVDEDDFYLARFVDYSSPDGRFRKYRVVLVDGSPYASHLAISDHWIVHYLSGGMADDAWKRAEEERFMADFDDDFARRHEDALAAIAERVGLEYLVVDCAEARDGRLLVFEADNSAVVHAMDSADLFPYKQPQMRRITSAFRSMLTKAVPGPRRCSPTGGSIPLP